MTFLLGLCSGDLYATCDPLRRFASTASPFYPGIPSLAFKSRLRDTLSLMARVFKGSLREKCISAMIAFRESLMTDSLSPASLTVIRMHASSKESPCSTAFLIFRIESLQTSSKLFPIISVFSLFTVSGAPADKGRMTGYAKIKFPSSYHFYYNRV